MNKKKHVILTNLEIKTKNNQLENLKKNLRRKQRKTFENNEIVNAYKAQRTAELK